MSKTTGFTNPEEYKFQEDKQFIFEGILYSALTLYNNGGASRSKLAESHKRFVQEIEQKNEEKYWNYSNCTCYHNNCFNNF